MSIYKLLDGGNCILLVPSQKIIPADDGNSDYQEYLAWLADGNQPDPVERGSINNKLDIELHKYNEDLQNLRNQWVAADIADGPNAATKKEQIRASFTTRKAEYLSKVAQIKAEG